MSADKVNEFNNEWASRFPEEAIYLYMEENLSKKLMLNKEFHCKQVLVFKP